MTISVLRGLIKKRWDIPAIKMDDDSFSVDYDVQTSGAFSKKKTKKSEKQGTPTDVEKQKETVQSTLDRVTGFTTIARRFLKNIRVHEFRWESVLGTGDAATTGTISGFAWTGKSAVFALIAKLMTVKHLPHLNVTPVFQVAFFRTSLSCIVSFSVGNAMRGLIRVLIHVRKGKKQTPKHNPQDRNVSKEA
ncbi:DUF2953 domain-containing protein [Salicibibacter cibi]|uniref:DUF2953 domain-containing protein n=1 Tax=Salicibibacter cibi TaxID=2743001 RepID=A0A7T7CGF1_9BACI|nr:DUF2953 domain-containing protein [Salicibibacter cibi]QQK81137.1 DUF2953 domain-containing protein [Salicibibacter cibi]